MLATQNETNSCHQFRRHMERISPGSTDSCRVVEQLMCRADVPNSLQCQRSLIIAGDGATPSRHLLNYPRLHGLRCLHCLLFLVGPAATANASAVELLKLLIWYNDPVDYKGENGQQ